MKLNDLIRFTEEHDEEHWISVSDLMSVLMIVFLFIAIFYIEALSGESQRVREVEDTLYDKLLHEFKDDLTAWNVELERKDVTWRFKEPDVLFDTGDAILKEKFKRILDDFFPRYLRILQESKCDIEEVRIEGHTSSEWYDLTGDEAYFKNMHLSQHRTMAVLQYNLSLPTIAGAKEWVKPLLTANGLSSSRLIFSANGRENKVLSRRVEFKVRTKKEQKNCEVIVGSQ